MLERITAQDRLWRDPPFRPEEARFNLMYRLMEAKDGLFLTDRESVLLAQSSPDMPAWIWTAGETLSGRLMDALREACAAHGVVTAIAKPEVAQTLFSRGRVTLRLLANQCPRLVRPSRVDGAGDCPCEADVPVMAEMLASFLLHVEGEEASREACLERARSLADNGDAILWRAPDGTPAALASIGHRAPRHGRINMVYTVPGLRGKGYAGMAVASLCRRVAADGLMPMLYTNADYPPSNRAYAKVGFVPVGLLARAGKEDLE